MNRREDGKVKPEIFSYRRIIEDINDGVYFVDTDRVIRYWNKAAERISGYSAGEVVGSSCADDILVHVDGEGHSLCRGMCPLAESIATGTPMSAEVYMHHRDGHRLPVWVRTNVLRENDGKVIGGVEIFTDISEQFAGRLRIKELEKIALLDSLTGMPNRHFLEQELEKVLAEHKRYRLPFGLLFLDIDNFKRFNDSFGHDAGDRVLRIVANTLTASSRVFDMFGRWGGEEFLGIIRNAADKQVIEIAERMRVLVASSNFSAEGSAHAVTVSVGATMVRNGDTVDTLFKRADSLMYASKKKGKNCVTFG